MSFRIKLVRKKKFQVMLVMIVLACLILLSSISPSGARALMKVNDAQEQEAMFSPGPAGVVVTIAIGLGTAIAVYIIIDMATSKWTAFSFGYAIPEPDYDTEVKHVRWDPAIAGDVDTDDEGADHYGQALTELGLFWDTLDPISLSHGSYYNICRTFKNGLARETETSGPLPEGVEAIKLDFDIKNLPVGKKGMKIIYTTGQERESYDVVASAGAQFDGTDWEPWGLSQLTQETDPNIIYGHNYSSPAGEPSLYEMLTEAELDNAIDIFPYFKEAVDSAGTTYVDGELVYQPFTFTVPLSPPVPMYGSSEIPWFSMVEVDASAVRRRAAVFPNWYTMVAAVAAAGGLGYLVWRRRSARQQS